MTFGEMDLDPNVPSLMMLAKLHQCEVVLHSTNGDRGNDSR